MADNLEQPRQALSLSDLLNYDVPRVEARCLDCVEQSLKIMEGLKTPPESSESKTSCLESGKARVDSRLAKFFATH